MSAGLQAQLQALKSEEALISIQEAEQIALASLVDHTASAPEAPPTTEAHMVSATQQYGLIEATDTSPVSIPRGQHKATDEQAY